MNDVNRYIALALGGMVIW